MLVIDTHVWLWWHGDPERLSARARTALEEAPAIGVPAICCWEVALLSRKGRIVLDREVLDWLDVALSGDVARLLPVNPAIACRAVAFGSSVPKDPADRIILATAVEHAAPLVTADTKLAASGLVKTIW